MVERHAVNVEVLGSNPSNPAKKPDLGFYVRSISDIEKLIKLLRANGISKFKEGTFELSLSPVVETSTAILPNENQLPPDLRTDNINNFDTILHWSGSGDDHGDKETVSGTGDVPLEGLN